MGEHGGVKPYITIYFWLLGLFVIGVGTGYGHVLLHRRWSKNHLWYYPRADNCLRDCVRESLFAQFMLGC